MVQIFIQLGRSRALVLAEVSALLPEAEFSYAGGEVLLARADLTPTLKSKLDSLGGAPRWGEVIMTELELVGAPERELMEKIADYLVQETKIKDFTFSFLPVWGELNVKDYTWAKHCGLEIKKILKEHDRRLRFFVTRELNAPTAVLFSEKMATATGCDLVFLVDKEKVMLGRTRFLQNVSAWSARDYERPARDAKVGMLPPKVARSMINIALGTREPNALLDPFCGSGTVLQEALLLGFKHVIGTDESQEQLNNTALNLKQLRTPVVETSFTTGQAQNSELKTTLIPSPFSNLPDKLGAGSQNLLVTEPYLGLPHTAALRQKLLETEVASMNDFFYKFIKFLESILRLGGRACFVVPVWHQHDESVYLSIDKMIEAASLKVVKTVSDEHKTLVADYLSPRGQILYGRDQQLIWREIWLVEKA